MVPQNSSLTGWTPAGTLLMGVRRGAPDEATWASPSPCPSSRPCLPLTGRAAVPLDRENSTPGSLRDKGHEAKTQAGPSGRRCRLSPPEALNPGRLCCFSPGLVSVAAIDSPAAGGKRVGLCASLERENQPVRAAPGHQAIRPPGHLASGPPSEDFSPFFASLSEK